LINNDNKYIRSDIPNRTYWCGNIYIIIFLRLFKSTIGEGEIKMSEKTYMLSVHYSDGETESIEIENLSLETAKVVVKNIKELNFHK